MSVPETNEYDCGFCKTRRSTIYSYDEDDRQVVSNSECRPCERCILPNILRYLIRPSTKTEEI